MAKKSTAKKSADAALRPVKEKLTQSGLARLIAEECEVPLKTATQMLKTLSNIMQGSIHPKGVGEFTLPGVLKVSLRKVPARKAGTLIRNPATGEMVPAAAKPASVRVKVRALSKMKKAAAA